MQDERKAQMKESSIMELREVNRMMYLRPDNGSLVDKRTHKEYNFSNLSYTPGSLGQCIIQSAADAVWGPSSYLKMKVRFSNSAEAIANITVGKNGSLASNLIESMRLTHRSGEIIEFIDNYNLLASIIKTWNTDAEDSKKLDSLLGGGIGVLGDVKTYEVPAAAGGNSGILTVDLIFPLWLLCGCFNNKDQYIPPNFLAGSKLELKFASNLVTFASAVPATVAIQIEPSIVLDSAKVYDSVAAQLLDQQSDVARSGLQFTYSTWFNNSSSTSTTQINVDVQQSASITQKVLCVLRRNDEIAANDRDSFQTESALADYQWRLGSTYYPQARVQLGPKQQSEAYMQSLIAWDSAPCQYQGHKSEGNCDVSLTDFQVDHAEAAADANSVSPHYATTLEKSGVGLTLTGEPTNNSRSLNFSATCKDAQARDVQIFLMYTRIANIMGQNLVVDR